MAVGGVQAQHAAVGRAAVAMAIVAVAATEPREDDAVSIGQGDYLNATEKN